MDGGDPPAVLQALDEVGRRFKAPSFSSCVYGLIDVHDAQWTYSSAGHPPPLLIRDGSVCVLPAPHGPPVGTELVPTGYTSATVAPRHNDVLALYTDGLVERRGESLDAGVDRLAHRLTCITAGHDLSDLCTEVAMESWARSLTTTSRSS